MLNSTILMIYYLFRGGGGRGKKWHHDGQRTKKINSINDYISCARFLIDREIVQENKLAGWGCSAGGLLVASAINFCPDLFQAAVLKVLFLSLISCQYFLTIFVNLSIDIHFSKYDQGFSSMHRIPLPLLS